MITPSMTSIPAGTIITPTLVGEEGQSVVAGVYRVLKTLERDFLLAMMETPDGAPCEDFDFADLVGYGYVERLEFVNVDVALHAGYCRIEPGFEHGVDEAPVPADPPV